MTIDFNNYICYYIRAGNTPTVQHRTVGSSEDRSADTEVITAVRWGWGRNLPTKARGALGKIEALVTQLKKERHPRDCASGLGGFYLIEVGFNTQILLVR